MLSDTRPGVVVFSPHVDDEVLGCFAWLAPGCHVVWFGVEDHREVDREERLREAAAVAAATGISHSLFELPVNDYRIGPALEIAERVVRDHAPRTVLLPCPSYNQDHRVVHDAVRTALRPHDRLPFVPRVLVYEQPHAVLWPREAFEPALFRPIDIDAKLTTWHLHRSQNRGHRSDAHLRALATLRGQQAGVPFAEGFGVLRWVEP